MPTPEEEAKIKADKQTADDAAAKAAVDKKAADDAAAAAGGDDTITIKKKDWEKTNSDLDNYRTGLINKKANDRSLDSNSGVVEGAGGATLDEKKVIEIATKASQANMHKANEKAAIKEFLKTHSDYTEDKNWQELLPYLPKINYDDPAAIVDAMEGAVLLHKRSSGTLDTYLAEQREAAKREGEMNANVNLGFGAGGNGQRINQGDQTGKLPESTVKMGEHFGHDEAKLTESLKEIGKNDEGAFEINVRAPKKAKK
jgi:hypothetical protein